MDETEILMNKVINDNRELMERLARGATHKQIEKEFWCPYCKKYINEKNIIDDMLQSSKPPMCGTCGNIVQWNYVYKNGLKTMIELFTIPKEHIKMFFDWPSRFFKDGIELNIVDNCVWYSLIDIPNTELIECKLNVETVNKGVIKADIQKLIKVYNNNFTFHLDNNTIAYLTKNGKHTIPTLSDPKVKTSTLPGELKFPTSFIIKKENINELFEEVIKLVKSTKDSGNYIIFKLEDKYLKVYSKDTDEYHEYKFPNEINAENYISSFSVNLVEDALFYYNEFDTVKISMGTDFPMKFEFKKDEIEFTTFISPRIEKD